MLHFAKEYAREYGYLEGWVKPDDFWGNLADRRLHPDKPRVIEVSYVAPMFDEDKEGKSYWRIPRVLIDSNFGNPRIAVVDRDENFCSLTFSRDDNEFTEGQFWRKHGLELARFVKARIEVLIHMSDEGFDYDI